ncbi:MAG TPA: radical SAM protein [Thermoplasmatales archaeon]|nr:radical SAM protein [Thermoplasmatales archaeon]
MEICEIFYSIQGEGVWSGYPTVFVRVSGCNLRCSYCDTTYAFEAGEDFSVDEIVRRVAEFKVKYVCVTGGEPLLQKETFVLIRALLREGYRVVLETNGSMDVSPFIEAFREYGVAFLVSCDIKCPSSGMHRRMRFENIGCLRASDQLKFVIKNREDYDYAKHLIDEYQPVCVCLFQPVWGTDLRRLAGWMLEDGVDARFSLQLHKVIWGERRGV